MKVVHAISLPISKQKYNRGNRVDNRLNLFTTLQIGYLAHFLTLSANISNEHTVF